MQVNFEHELEEWRKTLIHSDQSTYNREEVNENCSAKGSSTSTQEKRITLGEVLRETKKGRQLTQQYKDNGKFTEEQRKLLIKLIAYYYEEHESHMTITDSHLLEREILRTFPSEKIQFYRNSRRGRLYNKFINAKVSTKNVIPKKKDNKVVAAKVNIGNFLYIFDDKINLYNLV